MAASDAADLRQELADVRARLADSEETLRAIRHGEVDALVVGPVAGEERLFTLSSADRPYRYFVEGMSDGAATVSGDGIVLFANQALADLVSATCHRIVGTPFHDSRDRVRTRVAGRGHAPRHASLGAGAAAQAATRHGAGARGGVDVVDHRATTSPASPSLT
jgi:PAS domain-containing protein